MLTIKQQDNLISCMEKLNPNDQMIKVNEELAELIQAVCKWQLCGIKDGVNVYNHVVEEIADVYIMLYQLQEMLNIETNKIQKNIDFKIDRLWSKVK